MIVEVNFERTGFSRVYVDGQDVVVDNGYNKFRRHFEHEIDDKWLLIAIGEFECVMQDKILGVNVIEDSS